MVLYDERLVGVAQCILPPRGRCASTSLDRSKGTMGGGGVGLIDDVLNSLVRGDLDFFHTHDTLVYELIVCIQVSCPSLDGPFNGHVALGYPREALSPTFVPSVAPAQ